MNQLDQLEHHAQEMLKLVAELRRQQNIVVLHTDSVVQSCLSIVVQRTGVEQREILNHRRPQKLCDARNIFWWLLVNIHGYTHERAAWLTGKRERSAATYGISRLTKLMSVDPTTKALVELCADDARRSMQQQQAA